MKHICAGKGLIALIESCHYYTDEEVKNAVKLANDILQQILNYGGL